MFNERFPVRITSTSTNIHIKVCSNCKRTTIYREDMGGFIKVPVYYTNWLIDIY